MNEYTREKNTGAMTHPFHSHAMCSTTTSSKRYVCRQTWNWFAKNIYIFVNAWLLFLFFFVRFNFLKLLLLLLRLFYFTVAVVANDVYITQCLYQRSRSFTFFHKFTFSFSISCGGSLSKHSSQYYLHAKNSLWYQFNRICVYVSCTDYM